MLCIVHSKIFSLIHRKQNKKSIPSVNVSGDEQATLSDPVAIGENVMDKEINTVYNAEEENLTSIVNLNDDAEEEINTAEEENLNNKEKIADTEEEIINVDKAEEENLTSIVEEPKDLNAEEENLMIEPNDIAYKVKV